VTLYPSYLYCTALESVFLWASNPDMHGDRLPATQHTSCRWPRLDLAVCMDRAYRQPANMQPSVIID